MWGRPARAGGREGGAWSHGALPVALELCFEVEFIRGCGENLACNMAAEGFKLSAMSRPVCCQRKRVLDLGWGVTMQQAAGHLKLRGQPEPLFELWNV